MCQDYLFIFQTSGPTDRQLWWRMSLFRGESGSEVELFATCTFVDGARPELQHQHDPHANSLLADPQAPNHASIGEPSYDGHSGKRKTAQRLGAMNIPNSSTAPTTGEYAGGI
jgi:hypothetical protein